MSLLNECGVGTVVGERLSRRTLKYILVDEPLTTIRFVFVFGDFNVRLFLLTSPERT